MSKTVLSGMQPSGILHLGNYIGAICNWKDMIKKNPDYNYKFMIADLHSLTSLKDGAALKQNIIDASLCYLACGIDFEQKNISIFQQSKVKSHTELAWIFQTITPLGWLERMTQFKDKESSINESLSDTKNKILDIQHNCRFYFKNRLDEIGNLSNRKDFNDESLMAYAYLVLDDGRSEHVKNYFEELKRGNENLRNDIDAAELDILKYIETCKVEFRKNKSIAEAERKKSEEKINSGLFTYPTLMAADILLYSADFVPVGEDQKQHIEFTRDLAGKFNREYKTDIFKLPVPIISEGARIMSLTDGRKKMSKSDISELSRILLTDEDDAIIKKIAKAKTDSIANIYYDKENRPEVSNLMTILSVLLGVKLEEIQKQVEGFGGKQFKDLLSEVIISKISSIRETIKDLRKNFDIEKSLQRGNEIANLESENLMKQVRSVVGIF